MANGRLISSARPHLKAFHDERLILVPEPQQHRRWDCGGKEQQQPAALRPAANGREDQRDDGHPDSDGIPAPPQERYRTQELEHEPLWLACHVASVACCTPVRGVCGVHTMASSSADVCACRNDAHFRDGKTG